MDPELLSPVIHRFLPERVLKNTGLAIKRRKILNITENENDPGIFRNQLPTPSSETFLLSHVKPVCITNLNSTLFS